MCGEWRYHHQGAERTLVYMPGWATDARLLPRNALTWNIVTIDGLLVSPSQLDALAAFLRENNLPPVTLAGWSLGGFLAVDFARLYPDLVNRVLLTSIRKRYPAEGIEALRTALRADAAKGMKQFYRQCFFPAQMGHYPRFRAELEAHYLRDFPLDSLMTGLDCLASMRLSSESLPSCPTTILHGTQDIIAPLEEVRELAEAAGISLRILDAAHALPWMDEWVTVLNDA